MWLFQQPYSQLEVIRFKSSNDRCPKDGDLELIHQELDLVGGTSMSNYTKAFADNVDDRFSGTLSAAALQCILEYTTRPGDAVLTLDAQFGAIFEAAENCGRLVYATEAHEYFKNDAKEAMAELVAHGSARAIKEPERKIKARKVVLLDDKDDDDDPAGVCPSLLMPNYSSS